MTKLTLCYSFIKSGHLCCFVVVPRSDSHTTHEEETLTDSIRLLKRKKKKKKKKCKVEWDVEVGTCECSLSILEDSPGSIVCCRLHGGAKGNGRSAGLTGNTISGLILHLGNPEVLMSLRHCLRAQSQRRITPCIGRHLEERGVVDTTSVHDLP